MDADALRMLADLGIERRDAVSAPVEVAKGRNYQDDPRQQAAAAAAFEGRRNKHDRVGDASVSDGRAARLKAWNTETTFETDEVTGQLENRWSGQGHRAGLNLRHLNQNDPWESVDARYGEERRLYLQERGGNLKDSPVSRPMRSGQDRFRDLLGGRGSTPRTFSDGRHKDRGRTAVTPPRSSNQARAPSPRSFGTVRFAAGSRPVRDHAAPSPSLSNPGMQAAALLRSKVANATKTPQSISALSNGAQDHAAGGSAAVHLDRHAAGSLPTSAVNGTHAQQPNPRLQNDTCDNTKDTQATTALRANVTNGIHPGQLGFTATHTTPATPTSAQANPGLQAAAALRAAASSMDGTSTQQSGASASKDLSATKAAEPADLLGEERKSDPFTVNVSGFQAWNALRATTAKEKSGRSPPAPKVLSTDSDNKSNGDLDQLPIQGPARDQLIREAIGLAKRNDEREISEYLETHKERKWMVQAAKKARMQVEEETDQQIREYGAMYSRQMPFVRAAMAVFAPHRSPAAIQQPPTAAASAQMTPPAPLKTLSTEVQRSSSDTTAYFSGRSSDAEGTAETAASTPLRTKLGTLTATFFDMADKFLGIHQLRVSAPVRAEISVTSRAKHYNPRDLIMGIEALAQSMVDRTQGLEGVRLADDGLWVEEEL